MLKSAYIRYLNTGLRVLIALLCLWFLYREFFIKDNFNTLWNLFISTPVTFRTLTIIAVALVLVFVNWGLETFKWHMLIARVEPISWFKAFESVISGITFSLFTPNRIGEFAARIFYLESNHRIKGILISIIGSVSQLCITMIAGSFCFCYYLIVHQDLDNLEKTLLITAAVMTSTLILLFYFNMDILRTLLLKINRAKRTRIYLNVFSSYSAKELSKILTLSLVRYLTFSFQYFLLLQFFQISLSLFEGFVVISSIFFVLAIIPTIALAELGIRGAAAIYFLGSYSDNSLGILASSYGLWCINLALPAVLGLLFLPRINFFRK